MYYAAIGMIAILILVIVNQDILLHPKTSFEKAAWSVYRRFLYAVLAYYVTDVAWGVLGSLGMTAALFADTTLYFVLMGAGVLLWCEFTIVYLEDESPFGRILVGAGRILACTIALLSAVNVFSPVLFTFDASGTYHELPARSAILVVQIVLLLLISGRALSSMLAQDTGAKERVRHRILGWFGLIMATFLFAQLWFALLPLYSIAYMLGTCMLHTFVANDEKEEYHRGLEEAREVAELKETIESLIDNMPGMTFSKDAETGVYLACNQAFADYAHRPGPEDVVGATDAEIFDAATAAQILADDRMALSISVPYIFYEDVPDAAGNQRQLQTTKLKYTDATGRLCVLGMCQDVTDLVRIQHENALTKEAYEQAVRTGVVYTHIAQTLARDYRDLYYVNCDTEEYVEYAQTDDSALTEIRRGWHFFSDCKEELASRVHPDDRDAFLASMRRKTLMAALDCPTRTVILTYRQLTDEGTIYVRSKVSRMADDERYIILGTTDIDAETRDAIARAASLAEALTQAEASREKQASRLFFMGQAMHSPINEIVGHAALALRTDDVSPAAREHLLQIDESARSLLKTVNEALDLGRIEAGRMVLASGPLVLSDLVEDLSATVSPLCTARGIDLVSHVDEAAMGTYVGDEERLGGALASMLSHVVDVTERGGTVALTVERAGTTDDGRVLHVCMRGSTSGVAEDALGTVFEPHTDTGQPTASPHASTGPSLALAKGVLELMGGAAVASREEEGIRLDACVPLTLADDEGADAGTTVDVGALRALVVDDSPVEAEHERMVLEDAGIRADATTDGEQALSMLEDAHAARRPYDLVLIDWSMPGMSGLQASLEIRARYGSECTVVAMTSFAWDDIYQEATRAGVEAHLAKPLSPTRAVERIRRIALRSKRLASGKRCRANLVGRRVLLAVASKINADIMIDTLELEGMHADHASNGRDAYELFSRSVAGTYAAILMDVRMPEMDGLAATRAIRSMDRADARRIPIIALTANAFDEDVERSLSAGMNAHLAKPVEATRLVELLGELVFEAEAPVR